MVWGGHGLGVALHLAQAGDERVGSPPPDLLFPAKHRGPGQIPLIIRQSHWVLQWHR